MRSTHRLALYSAAARVRHHVLMASLLLVSAGLAACGGGGGGTSGSPGNGGGTSPPPVTQYTLSVTISGSGTVTSAPSGINCGTTCSASYDSGTQVTLTATPATGSTFSGWSGACSGSSPTCTVAMTQARSVTASFASGGTAGQCPNMPPIAAPSTGVTGLGLVNYTAMNKPALGVSFSDPDFTNTGIRIKRITDTLAQFKANVAFPAYPTTQAWNCNETRLVLYVTQAQAGGQGGWAMFDGNSYQFIRFLPIAPSDIEQFWWSRTDPAKLYYIANYEMSGVIHAELTAVDVETQQKTVVHDFIPDLQRLGWPTTGPVRAGYPFKNGDGNRVWGLGAGGIPNVNGQLGLKVFGFDMSTGQLTQYPGVATDQARGTTPAPRPSGRGWWWNPTFNNGGANDQTWVLDTAGNVVRKLPYSSYEHLDTGLNASGQDVLVGTQFGTAVLGNLIMANLDTGAITTLIGEANGYGYPRTGSFTSATAWRNPAWVAGAMIGNIYGTDASGPNASPKTLLDQEIIVANINTGQVYRIAHNRTTGNYSNAPQSNYWAQPNVTISPSGTRILFNSDWGNANPSNPVLNPSAAVDTYVIELPGYHTP